MRYKLKSGYIAQKVGAKAAIFKSDESKLVTFNSSATLIFNGIKLGWDKPKITEKLQNKFQVDQAKAEADIDAFIELLLQKEIIEPIP